MCLALWLNSHCKRCRSIVIMNKSDKWIEEYLIPKLISDGKILSTGVDNFTTNNTLHVVSSSKANHRTNNHHDNNNGSNVGIVSGRWDGGDNKNENNVEIKSLNIKTLSVDGFMLSAPCKVVEIECIDKRKPNCVNKLFLVVKVRMCRYCLIEHN